MNDYSSVWRNYSSFSNILFRAGQRQTFYFWQDKTIPLFQTFYVRQGSVHVAWNWWGKHSQPFSLDHMELYPRERGKLAWRSAGGTKVTSCGNRKLWNSGRGQRFNMVHHSHRQAHLGHTDVHKKQTIGIRTWSHILDQRQMWDVQHIKFQ